MSRAARKSSSNFPSNQSYSAHALFPSKATCPVLWKLFPLTYRGCAGSPEPLLFAYVITAFLP